MAEKRAVIYCIIPGDLAEELHQPLREFYRGNPEVEIIVERRERERRSGDDRRQPDTAAARSRERRKVRARSGRRIDERRSAIVPAEPPDLPEPAVQHRGELRFVERMEPSTLRQEDADTARLVARIQAGDRDLFNRMYLRYFDRVYAYLKITLRDGHEAEDATQDVFIKVFEALPAYERREVPFRAWLFRIVRNVAINRLRMGRRLTVEAPEEVARRSESKSEMPAPDSLRWIEDDQLLAWIEQLPLAQRQVIVLRYMLDHKAAEIATVVDRSPDAVRQLHQRAMRFLRERMSERRSGADTGRGADEDDPGRQRARPKAMTRLQSPSPVIRARRYQRA